MAVAGGTAHRVISHSTGIEWSSGLVSTPVRDAQVQGRWMMRKIVAIDACVCPHCYVLDGPGAYWP